MSKKIEFVPNSMGIIQLLHTNQVESLVIEYAETFEEEIEVKSMPQRYIGTNASNSKRMRREYFRQKAKRKRERSKE